MIMDGQITVGNTTFKMEVLQDLTLTQAYERFNYLRRDIVKHAHTVANQNKKSKKGSKK
jgi:hypothetical protein